MALQPNQQVMLADTPETPHSNDTQPMLVRQTPYSRSTHAKLFAHIPDCEEPLCWRGYFYLVIIRRGGLLGPRRFFNWQAEWWLFLDFMSAPKNSWLHEGIYAQTTSSVCSRLGTE